MKIFGLFLLMLFVLEATAEARPFWKRKYQSQNCRLIGVQKQQRYKPFSKSQLKREKKRLEKWQGSIKASFVTVR